MLSMEHRDTGLTAQFVVDDIEEADFKYSTQGKKGAQGKISLSYGDIVALAGDYYGTFKELDFSDDDQVKSVRDGNVFQHDDCFDFRMTLKGKQIDYYTLALKNPEHFRGVPRPIGGTYQVPGPDDDSTNCYNAGHAQAMIHARQATNDGKPFNQRRAYAINAYYDHFLTDMFSSGHIRTPRRQLSGVVMPTGSVSRSGTTLTVKVSPAPIILDYAASKQMHDEDGLVGVWVTNRDRILNKSRPLAWKMLGDGSQTKSDENWRQCQATVFRSVAQVITAMYPNTWSSKYGNKDPLQLKPECYPPGAEIHGDSATWDYNVEMVSKLGEKIDLKCWAIPRSASEPAIIIPEYLVDRMAGHKGVEPIIAGAIRLDTVHQMTLKDKLVWHFETTPTKSFAEGKTADQPYPMWAIANDRLYVRLGESGTDGDKRNKYVAAEHAQSDKDSPPYQFDNTPPPPMTTRITGQIQGSASEIGADWP